MFNIKRKKGQSTVEYILLVTAVIAVMIMFATNQNGGLQGKLGGMMNQSANEMNRMNDKLFGASSHTSGSGASAPPSISVPVTNGFPR